MASTIRGDDPFYDLSPDDKDQKELELRKEGRRLRLGGDGKRARERNAALGKSLGASQGERISDRTNQMTPTITASAWNPREQRYRELLDSDYTMDSINETLALLWSVVGRSVPNDKDWRGSWHTVSQERLLRRISIKKSSAGFASLLDYLLTLQCRGCRPASPTKDHPGQLGWPNERGRISCFKHWRGLTGRPDTYAMFKAYYFSALSTICCRTWSLRDCVPKRTVW